MRTPVIVTFANQKGGVGKTTLCIAFANYLFSKGVRVMVIDCDFQHSIVKRRKADIQEYGDVQIPYEVISAGSMKDEEMASMIERLYNDPSIELVLIDSAGSLTTPGLATLLVNTDVMVTPFHYDNLTSPSTLAFLILLKKLRARAGERMNTKVFVVPNNTDARVGKAKEKEAWKITRKKFSEYGEVTEAISWRASMLRVSTVGELDRQFPVTKPVFDTVYSFIFGSVDPLREVILRGIQLSQYCDELEKQKKKALRDRQKKMREEMLNREEADSN